MRSRLVRLALVVLSLIAVCAAPARAQTGAQTAAAQTAAVKVVLEGRIEGPSAPFFVALDNGLFKAEGLDVTIEPSATALDPVTKVAAGTFDIGVADFNTLIRWRDQNPTAPPKAVFIIQNRPAYAIVTRKSRGVNEPRNLDGKKLGAPNGDPASAQWPIFAKLNGIDASTVTLLNVGLLVREPMLAAGEVDAITALSYGAPINLREKSVPVDDLSVMMMSDYGLELYGTAIIVNPKFAAEKPEAVKGFLRAYTKALKETIKDPVAAVLPVIQRNTTSTRDIELERLLMALKIHVITPEVKANGVGEVDPARFAKALDQIALTYAFKVKPKLADVFDESFLPPEADRMFE